jgi:hypothetical protein
MKLSSSRAVVRAAFTHLKFNEIKPVGQEIMAMGQAMGMGVKGMAHMDW